MQFHDLINYYGTQAAAASAIGTSAQVVSAWKRNGIPLGRQYEIQVLTGGQLRASPTQTKKPAKATTWSKRTTFGKVPA
jgi:hypothetical protein